MEYGHTAYNRTVYASPPVGGSASATARSFRYAPFPRRCSGTFCPPCKCYAFAYSGGQNVANSRNVIRNCPYIGWYILYKNQTQKMLTN
jgi:hypothetical protein